MSRKTWYIISIMVMQAVFTHSLLAQQGTIKFHFIHKANGKPIEKDSSYHNIHGETYQLQKLKYYLSNIKINEFSEEESYHLVDAFNQDTFTIKLPVARYSRISFMIGVDSLRNCSGAQTGALDPLNDMFWTWNSGYVMFKLEGSSPQSKADLNRIEHHIGGYSGKYRTMRKFEIDFPRGIEIKNGSQQDILIEMDLDKYWNSVNSITIAGLPLIMTPGKTASEMADNLASLFSLKSYTE
jgi:hypothetical protein